MFLAIDIGNTSTKFGIFDGETLTSKFLIPTNREYTPLEINEAVGARLNGIDEGALISSVVPEVDGAIANYLSGLNSEARFVRTNDDLGLTFNFPNVEMGTDRLVNSFAAAEIYGVPCIVIAFGTATTFDVIDKNREHRGGLIAPGPTAAAKALEILASKLPEVEITEPSNVLNTTTVSAIQAGIFYSQIGLVGEAIRHIKAEIGEAKVVATGGFAQLIAPTCKVVDVVDADLTLKGLRLMHERRR